VTNKLPNNIDTFGQWFVEYEKRNECCDGIAGTYDKNKNLEIRLYPHARYDGYSALMEHIGELNKKVVEQHLLNTACRNPPKISRQLLLFFKFLATLPFRPRPRKMKMKAAGWPKQPNKVKKERIAWRIFDIDESKKILKFSKENKTTLNSYLLANIIQHLDPIWVNKKRNISIGIPISLHANLGSIQIPRNRFSIIDIWLNESNTHTEINRQIKSNLRRGMHFAAWFSYNLPQYIGSWFYSYFLLTADMFQSRNILYTYLGNWDAMSGTGLFTIPPVIYYIPISVSAINWEGKLAITLQLHPHIDITNDGIETIIESWARDLLRDDSVRYWASSSATKELNIRRKD
jgi:hypothetical protein